MAVKDEGDVLISEIVKTEEVSDNTNDEAPGNLEIVNSDTTVARNDVSQAATKEKANIDILLKATGNAPIMKQKKWSVNQDWNFGRVSEFVKKYLKLDASENLFLYINQTFAPPPDQLVKNLFDCYAVDGRLIIHYCKNPAWG